MVDWSLFLVSSFGWGATCLLGCGGSISFLGAKIVTGYNMVSCSPYNKL